MNYYETYAPVVTWFAIRLMIIFGILFKWSLRQVDFIMAHPQAPIEMDIYMELPQGIETAKGNSKDHVLKLLKHIYGQKQAGRFWNEYLVKTLNSVGFKQSLIDDCVFYRDNIIFMVHVDDGIFIDSKDSQLKNAIKELQDLNLKIKDQGHPADYIGVNISKLKDGSYKFTQRALLTQSSRMLARMTPSPRLFQPKSYSSSKLSRMIHHLMRVLTISLQLES